MAAARSKGTYLAAKHRRIAARRGPRRAVVAAAADQVSASVQTVATSSGEMEASIRDIAVSTSEAARVGHTAMQVAATTNETVAKLGDSSVQIAAIVKVITAIAEQTNLLALNATIEAARAGVAGKGFAVVATEVKELAKETAQATDEITQRVQTVQTDTAAAVAAIAQISTVIGQMNDLQVTISSAVEEQTATTREMNRSVSEAAAGSEEIAANITGVATGAQLTTSGVGQSQLAVSELARMSTDLKALVDRFQR